MFNFLLLDNKKYKKGDNIEDFKVSNYIDESNDVLVQHLAHIYCEVLHITMQFDIDEKEVNALRQKEMEHTSPPARLSVLETKEWETLPGYADISEHPEHWTFLLRLAHI